MKIFAPNQLIQVVKKIEEEHPLVGKEYHPIPMESLYALIQRINNADDEELVSLSSILSKRDVQALCYYLQDDRYHADLNKICSVISYRFDVTCFNILLRVWQNAPSRLMVLNLLGVYDTSKYRTEEVLIPEGLLKQWSKAAYPVQAVVKTCEENKDKGVFEHSFVEIGLQKETNLYYQSYVIFFKTATMNQFLLETDERIGHVLSKAVRQDVEEILLAFLRDTTIDILTLKQFKKVFELAYNLWKAPKENYFPANHEAEFARYRQWYALMQLSKFLGDDSRREIFWRQFLTYPEVDIEIFKKIDNNGMLALYFGDIVVTEFLVTGATYFYRKEYFKTHVRTKISQNVNTTSRMTVLKSWLLYNSDYLRREEHRGYWESKFFSVLRSFDITK